jgi:tellurite resistance protein
MGLFGDLFKASDWSITELQAIFQAMTAMGAMDGKLDEDEKIIAGEMLTKLPGSKSINLEEFGEGALKMTPQETFSTLKGMSSNKRKVAVAMLYVIAKVDGNVDDKEAQFFLNVARILNVKMPSSN